MLHLRAIDYSWISLFFNKICLKIFQGLFCVLSVFTVVVLSRAVFSKGDFCWDCRRNNAIHLNRYVLSKGYLFSPKICYPFDWAVVFERVLIFELLPKFAILLNKSVVSKGYLFLDFHRKYVILLNVNVFQKGTFFRIFSTK